MSRRFSGSPDARDSRPFFRRPRKRGHDIKTLRLCRQVAEALSLALGSQCADPMLAELEVLAVTPAPDATRLLVTVRPAAPPTAELFERLAAAHGLLRSIAAESISRKRAPDLAFRVEVEYS